MADVRRRRVACFCDHVFEPELPTAIDLAARPETFDELQRGQFMAVSCPQCGKLLTPEFPCALRGVTAGSLGVLTVQLVPETDRRPYLRGKLGYDIGHPDRVVIGVPELAEKLAIFRQGLDDRAVEILKYLLRGRSEREAAAEASSREIIVTFAGAEGDRLAFHIEGLRAAEVGVARMERALYDKVVASLESRLAEEPYRLFCQPPYVSIRQIEDEG